MGFLTNLITAMTSDISVNTYTTGSIVYDHLPADFDYTKNWIVFGYSSNRNISTLDYSNIGSEYSLNIQVISPSVETVEAASDCLINHLINYDDGNIRSVRLTDDNLNIDTEKAIYFKTINFDILYLN